MRNLYLFVLVIILSVPHNATSQQANNVQTAYYLNLNEAGNSVVHDLLNESLNIQYQDRYGKSSEAELFLFNSKHELVATYSLSKAFGLNHFKISLGQVFSSWKEKDVYTCEFRDEAKHLYKMLLRKVPSETEEPSLNVFVNPIHLTCGEMTGNLVDFYGSITGGKSPYTVNWYVVNEKQSSFLYQPQMQVIERPGNTSVVRVDKNPNYYIMITVLDACGKEQKQMVYVQCDKELKKINTIFVEPIKQLNSKTIN